MKLRLVAASVALTLALSAGLHAKATRSGSGGAEPEIRETFSAAIIRYGSRGEDVYELQGRLKLLGFYHGRVDGVFGPKTLAAVRWFQSRFGLRVDGIVGPKTKLKLWQATRHWRPEMTPREPVRAASAVPRAGSRSGRMGLTEQEIRLMTHVVHGEARGEPYIGKVAVAAVILNRVRSPLFPDTVAGVIFQPGAFTAVSDGQAWLPPDAESRRAVLDAANGWDPTGGCLYYFNPATATSKWIWSRPQYKRIGKHIFTR
mgnify:CR=1 FL=1